MRAVTVTVLIFSLLCLSDALSSGKVESRGKKKKIALLIYFADLILKKVFVFKLIYAFIFWLVLHKAGYFLGWFISYLSQKKQEFKEPEHYHVPHHQHAEYGPPEYHHGPPEYHGSYHHGPYGAYDKMQRF